VESTPSGDVRQTSIRPGRPRRKRLERLGFGVPELAAAFGNSEAFWRKEIAKKNLEVLRLGRRVVVTRESLDAFLASAR